MPLYRTPELKDDSIYLENQKKISEALNTKLSAAGAAKSRYKKFHYYRRIIRDLFKNFVQIMRIMFCKNKQNVPYIAFTFEGGLGDKLRVKSVITELVKMYPNAVIDIYNTNKATLFVTSEIKNIRFYLKKHTLLVTKNYYDFVYDNCPPQPILIKTDNPITRKVINNIEKYKQIFKDNGYHDKTISCISVNKISAGVDNVRDDSTSIHYTPSPLEKFGLSKNDKIITFNVGAGENGSIKNVKCWQLDKWEKLIVLLKTRIGADIKIVNVGSKERIIKGADINTSGKTTLNELCSILDKAMLHIDIDGACVHIVNALGKMSVVLWGQSDPVFTGYAKNINIASSLCGLCATLGEKCPLGYDVPLCMQSIEPEFVADKICQIFK
jgi:ADP-heptose:LPS heptosyltransferase